MPNATRVDPYRNFNFLVEIQGITQAGFTDCSGFGASNDPIEYREGGHVTSPRKLPGMTKYTNITLKWGLTDSRELYDWFRDVVNGKIERKNGSIIVRDLDGTPKVRWNFYNAWPTKFDHPDFSAKSNDVAIETLELVVEMIERA
ncbi:MAG TPA: phage tail protein [Blastocatellia bacterium]|nr:phage tail protein [Blastocatellia bacterium]